MTDPLKNKFKHFTFKLYDKELRHDKEYFDSKFSIFENDSDVTILDSWYDYDEHVGIHKNGIFRSTSYKTIQKLYASKATKLPDLYLNFGDLANYKEYNGWIIYCIRRYDSNWLHYMPKQRILIEEPPVIIF